MTRKKAAIFSASIFLILLLGGLTFSVYARAPITQEVPRNQLIKLLESPTEAHSYKAIDPHEEEISRLCKDMQQRVGGAVHQVVHNNKRTLRTQNARPAVMKLRTLLAQNVTSEVEKSACTSDVLSRILKEAATWQLAAWQGMVAAGAFMDAGEYGAAAQVLERMRDLKDTNKAPDSLIPRLDRLIPHLHMMTAREALKAKDLPRAELFTRRAVTYILVRGEAFPGHRGRGFLALADLFQAQGRSADAELVVAEVMNLALAVNDLTVVGPVAYRKALLSAERGDIALARQLLKRSVHSYQAAGITDRPGYAHALANLNELTVWPEWVPLRTYLPG
ncbi:MAG: hypothetical protein OEY97_01100 [Nitrospirota bacterium]|nr:hypothetical protein [Nitrospirota bacterium]